MAFGNAGDALSAFKSVILQQQFRNLAACTFSEVGDPLPMGVCGLWGMLVPITLKRSGVAACFAAALTFFGGALPASAQSFFTTLIADPVVGADRGSASLIRKLDEPTQFLTFSNTGSDVSGQYVLGYGLARPDLMQEGDQLDVTAVWAGPSKDGWRELLAGGIGYRFPVGLEGTTAFLTVDYGDLIFGTTETLFLEAKADRRQIALGLVRERSLANDAKVRLSGELISRSVNAEVLGFPSLEEELTSLRLSAQYSRGVPLLFQQRLAVSLSKGFDSFGASESGNLLGSNPGAASDYLRVSFAAEASVPLSKEWVINAGLIGQWTDDSLPVSQRCGFETNAYARAFDYAVVVGDRCLGSRVEVAYNIALPDPTADKILFTQGFVGIDKGRIDNVANIASPGGGDSWSSLSAGIRTLSGNFLGEVAVTRILDRPDVAADQDRDRLWFRTAIQF